MTSMRVIHGFRDVPAASRGAAVAIGNFDGVHRGHQALIGRALAAGRATGRPAGVVLFEPHPREFFAPDKPIFKLTPLPRKLALIKALGADVAVVLAFDAALAAMTAEAFIGEVLVNGLGISHAVVGYDFHFGKGRGGSPATLQAAGDQRGFEVTVVQPVASDGEVFSSSAVRAKLSAGDVDGAARMLGHRWRVAGTVVGGAGRGTGLGFPTANVTMPEGTVLGHGIYAVRVHIGGESHDAAGYFGNRPTFDNAKPVLEVFLFEYDQRLYGREVEVEFCGFVRTDAKFESIEALKVQMAKDCDVARGMLRRIERDDPLAGLPLATA